jgi:hypothetical protein
MRVLRMTLSRQKSSRDPSKDTFSRWAGKAWDTTSTSSHESIEMQWKPFFEWAKTRAEEEVKRRTSTREQGGSKRNPY